MSVNLHISFLQRQIKDSRSLDKYLPQLYYNGTLAELAKEYLGSDSGVTGMSENGVFEEDTLEDFRANEK